MKSRRAHLWLSRTQKILGDRFSIVRDYNTPASNSNSTGIGDDAVDGASDIYLVYPEYRLGIGRKLVEVKT